MKHDNITDIFTYMRAYARELGERILQSYPALHQVSDPPSALLDELLRRPFPAQTLAIMGLAQRWKNARSASVVAECGTGKTLIALAAMHVHSGGRPFTALAMVPPHLVSKWAREAFHTVPGMRVFLIDSLRNGGEGPQGVNEARLRKGSIVREGLHISLPDLRVRNRSAGERRREFCSAPALFVLGRERAKLGYFWRHAYGVAQSGRNSGCVVNPDSGAPIIVGENRLTAAEFAKARIAEVLERSGKAVRRRHYSALWQADNTKISRAAPVDFIARYLDGFFDYAVCDEMHQLAGDTAQGNALGALAGCAGHIVGLTGTLLGGYADDLYNLLFRLEPGKMTGRGYSWGASGRAQFAQDYGVLETIARTEPEENACSEAKTTYSVHRRPGASPLLFGDFLMDSCAFLFLEDISEALPAYEEAVIEVAMDEELKHAYARLEGEMGEALKAHRGNRSVLSTMLNTLLLYPDRPYGIGDLWGWEHDERGRRRRFHITTAPDLREEAIYAKERALLSEIRKELGEGRRCQVFAVYTQKRDVTARLEKLLRDEGIACAVLRSQIETDKREAWYERRLREGVEVFIAHPRLVETGLDLLFTPTILFYESGYSLHTLRQASRRSWRIGQSEPVRVRFLCYQGTMQARCLRLMGKKLLVALSLEGKFSGEGLQALDDDADMLTAMARELVEKSRIGESADTVWRQLNGEHQRMFVRRPELPVSGMGGSGQALVQADPVETLPVLAQGRGASNWRRAASRPTPPSQGSLFD